MRIRYVSHFGPEGQFVAAKRLMLALSEIGVELTWTPMVVGDRWGLYVEPFSGRSVGDPDLDSFCNRPLEVDTVIVHLRPVFYPKWAELQRGKRLVGHTVWETDRLPPSWPALMAGMTDVIVPCRWNREVFLRSGVTAPVHVIPHIAVPGPRRERPSGRSGGADSFVFYSIGTWTVRKGITLLLRSFLETFTGRDPVRLILKTTETTQENVWYGRSRVLRLARAAAKHLVRAQAARPPSARAAVEKLTRRHRDPPEIRLVAGSVSDAEIDAIHREGDCFVSLTRAEGWGIPAFDAAARGTPVIITGYGGQMDYLNADRAGIVGYDLVPVREDNDAGEFRREQRWAMPRLAEASTLMRDVVQRPGEWRERAAALREKILTAYDGKRVAALLLAALEKG